MKKNSSTNNEVFETNSQVVALREEVKMEEFYVEYLERLLADVERHKVANNLSSESKASRVESPSENNVHETTKQSPDKCPSPVPVKEDISRLQNKCLAELSSTLSSNKRPKSEIPLSPDKVPEFRRNSDPDVPSNYVTVIEVGSSKKDKHDDSMKEEDEKGA